MIILRHFLYQISKAAYIFEMGLDIAMFVGAVDDEFLCSICKMVVENAVQSPCEHIFCGQCILKWLAIRKSCPVDQSYLNSIDIRPLPRYFRNLLDKMEVRCQFGKSMSPNACSIVHEVFFFSHQKDVKSFYL